MEPKLVPAAKAFILHEGKVLIVREAATYKTGTQIGNYDTPGGRMEPGQTVEENLQREIREETGLTITIGQPFYVNESRPVVQGIPWQIIRIFFACSATSDQVTLSKDHDDYQWIDPKRYRDYKVIPNLYPAFEAYLKIAHA